MISLLRRFFSGLVSPASTAPDAPKTPETPKAPQKSSATHPAEPMNAAQTAWHLPAGLQQQFLQLLFQPVLGHDLSHLEKPVYAAIDKLLLNASDAASLVPRVPAILPQVLKSLREKNLSTSDLAQQIAKDVVLVAELLNEVNGAYYSGGQPVHQLDQAIRLLGINGLRMLVAKNAFRPLIQNQRGHLTQQVAPLLWTHSDLCMQAVQWLARRRSLEEVHVFLAALLWNAGPVIALRATDQMGFVRKLPDDTIFLDTLLQQGRRLSAQVGRHWQFPPQVIAIIEEAASETPALNPDAQLLQQASQLAMLRLLPGDAPEVQECIRQLPDELQLFQELISSIEQK